ncbi:unnamed protein product [Ascophyllum nodosum]
MAKQADNHVDVYCQVSDEAVVDDYTDTVMFGATLLLSFYKLVGHVSIDVMVKVVYTFNESKSSHSFVIGPIGFQLRSCLQALGCGLCSGSDNFQYFSRAVTYSRRYLSGAGAA